MTNAAGTIGSKVGFACFSPQGNSFHKESLVLLNFKSGILGSDYKLCSTSN